jgi:hypothetical protein
MQTRSVGSAAFSRAMVTGAAVVATLAAAEGCGDHPAQPTQQSDVQAGSVTKLDASSETKSELGVAHWATWQENDGNATQTFFLGVDDRGIPRVLEQERLERAANNIPTGVQIGYASLAGANGLRRFRTEGNQLALERDDLAALPRALRGIDLLYADRERGVSGLRTPPSTGSSIKPAGAPTSGIKPTDDCLIGCDVTPKVEQCRKTAQATRDGCLSQFSTCTGKCLGGVLAPNGIMVYPGQPGYEHFWPPKPPPTHKMREDCDNGCEAVQVRCNNAIPLTKDCVASTESLIQRAADLLGSGPQAAVPAAETAAACRQGIEACIQLYNQYGGAGTRCGNEADCH